ncbi:MAG: hypothetical protein NVSMB19_15800 [Vulcanimicrobiaceae bacterium]
MDKQAEIGLLVGGAVVVVAIVAMKGGSHSVGATFASANPQSVAAVQSAGASEIASINALTLEKMRTAASTIVAIAQLQTTLDTTRLGVGAQEYGQHESTLQVGLQADSTNYATEVGGYTAGVLSGAQTEQARISAASSLAQAAIGARAASDAANIAAAAQIRAAEINGDVARYAAGVSGDVARYAAGVSGDVARYEASINGDVNRAALGVQKDLSNNAVTAARIGKPSWFASLTSAASNVAAAFLKTQSGGAT